MGQPENKPKPTRRGRANPAVYDRIPTMERPPTRNHHVQQLWIRRRNNGGPNAYSKLAPTNDSLLSDIRGRPWIGPQSYCIKTKPLWASMEGATPTTIVQHGQLGRHSAGCPGAAWSTSNHRYNR